MKKSLLVLVFAVALVVPAVAENMWVGGSLGFYTTSPKEGDSTSSFSIQPEFGCNLNEKMGIGIDLGYGYEKNSVDTITTISVSPFIRYEMFKIGGFAFLAKGSVFYNSEKYDDADIKYTSYGIIIVPVVTYSINKTWSIDATLDFASISFENKKCDDLNMEDNTVGIRGNSGNLASIGFSYHF